jgi:hypothetical protein
MIGQAAQGAGDRELLEAVASCEGQTATQIKWLKTRMKQAAAQALLVASWREGATASTVGGAVVGW